jgi:ABC-type nitrate/sulfonate/bicarbonate transport system substrate-binding protein
LEELHIESPVFNLRRIIAMQHKRNKLFTVLAGLLAFIMIVTACQPATTPEPVTAPATEAPVAPAPATEAPVVSPAATEAPTVAAPAELIPVRVGMTPFFDYQFWSVAKQFGWDKELGLDLQFTWLTQSGPSIQALANGSLDQVNTCVVCNFPQRRPVQRLCSAGSCGKIEVLSGISDRAE